ncbi:hypothetical protein F5X98DRAFT_46489 [Xylaria grammica]|nr:hypothetical protein F5X98DRAFT_46489 [Xylaria grammica]
MAEGTNDERKLHLVGVGVTHSVGLPMHNFIAQSLKVPWTFHNTECPTIEDLLDLARSPSTAGLVVTMPYKNIVMSKLDRLDDLANMIGACNNIYRDPSDRSKLVGTNTDWLGVKGSLLEQGDETIRPNKENTSTPALLVGAGGASRAAIYALSAHLHTPTIYVLNRDDGEVADLIRDTRKIRPAPTIIHVKSVEQASNLGTPYYIVGTVPDFPPKSESELAMAAILEHFLSRPGTPGVLLDMCFKPRQTRIIKLAQKYAWPTVEGTHVIGYQFEQQWKVWTGAESGIELDTAGAWKVLLRAAEESPAINF